MNISDADDDFMNFTGVDDNNSDSDDDNNASSRTNCNSTVCLQQKETVESRARAFLKRQKKNLRRIMIIMGFYFLSVMFYWNVEEWNVLDSFYFTTTTVFAVGYGDLVPTSDTSRMFTCFLIIIGLLVVFAELTSFIKGVLAFVKKQTRHIMKKDHGHVKGTTDEVDGLINDYLENHHHVDTNSNSLKFTPRARSILKNIGFVFAYILLGAIIFFFEERYSEVRSLYLAIVTVSTVGFGDFKGGRSMHDTTKVLLIFYIPGAFIVLSTCIGNVLINYNEMLAEQQRIVDCLKPVQYAALRKRMLADGGIDKLDFLLIMLKSNNSSINFKKDIKPWLDKYDELMLAGDVNIQGLNKLEEKEEQRCEHVAKMLESSQMASGLGLRKHLKRSLVRGRPLSVNDFKQAAKLDDNPLDLSPLAASLPPVNRRFFSEDSDNATNTRHHSPGGGDLELGITDSSSSVTALSVPLNSDRAETSETDSEPDTHHMTWTDRY